MRSFLPQICIAMKTVLLKTPLVYSISHAKLTPWWALIWVNFDPIQEIGPKVGGWCSFKGGCFFTRLWYCRFWVWACVPTDAVSFSDAHFGIGADPIFLDEVGCSGSESLLIDCPRSSTISCYETYRYRSYYRWYYRWYYRQRSHGGAGVRCQG